VLRPQVRVAIGRDSPSDQLSPVWIRARPFDTISHRPSDSWVTGEARINVGYQIARFTPSFTCSSQLPYEKRTSGSAAGSAQAEQNKQASEILALRAATRRFKLLSFFNPYRIHSATMREHVSVCSCKTFEQSSQSLISFLRQLKPALFCNSWTSIYWLWTGWFFSDYIAVLT